MAEDFWRHNIGIFEVRAYVFDAVVELVLSHPRSASQFPFITCLAPMAPCKLHIVVVKKVSGGDAGVAGPLLPPMIALLPSSCLIRVDVQNVRTMFYGLLRNHSPAQVNQCSATQEREREKKIRGLYS